ncbi:MAG TPA: MMPL family transporter, partial [Rubrivivax sp.]|nr:MMPL family transporter [Rubrivivax sp.]
MHVSTTNDQPLPGGLDAFDPNTGSLLERLVFNHRRAVIVLCALITLALGFLAATRLTLNASFERMLPLSHPYIQNYLENRNELRGLGNALRIVVANPGGDIYDPKYQDTLRKIHDELVLTPGVDRAWVKSLWSPAVRWTEVTEEGFRGGPVMPDNYDGSAKATEQLRGNIARSGIVGSLVGNDFKSSMIVVPLLDRDPKSGQRIDYRALSQQIESIRAKHEQVSEGKPAAVKIHVIGFAKLVGDLIDGLLRVALYFAFAAVVAAAIIYYYTRCVRSTVLVLGCSLVAVLWQLGLVAAFGFEIDPYSILVPFLVFAIGVSHGAQKMNGIMQDIGRGAHKLVAARYTFRRLFLAGLTALLADAVGFAVLMVIDIPVIQDLALTASIGVAVLILTNLILLPVLLSYVGVSPAAAARSLRGNDMAPRGLNRIWGLLERFTERRWATAAVLGSALLLGFGVLASTQLKIGDLDPGAPELRADSRYNRDNAYITAHYALSSDPFAVIVKTAKEGCLKYETLVEADRLSWALQQVPGVQTTVALPDAVR